MDEQRPTPLACRWCGESHHAVPLRRGERAVCSKCGGTLARYSLLGPSTLALAVTATVLAIPAALLPLVVVHKFGGSHESYLWTGIRALWRDGMPVLSVWVTLCGIAVPIALLGTLLVLATADRVGDDQSRRFWTRAAIAFQRWSMPEVQVLAVLVAFVKIGALVDVHPGAGLWFYAAAAVTILVAWRSSRLVEEDL
jgi:paraquat-inducible protein A